MPTVVWSEAASEDLQRHFDYLYPIDPDVAVFGLGVLTGAADSLKQHPDRGTLMQDGNELRELMMGFGKYGFIMHYRLLGDEAFIAGVYHGRGNNS